MAKNRFQKTDVVRLPLSDGDWIEVRRRLSGAEKKLMAAAAFTDFRQGAKDGKEGEQRFGVDFGLLSLSRTLTYLKDWSFRDEADKPVKCSRAAIEALDQETLDEIERALDAHVAAMEQEKNDPSGEPKLSLVSPSVAS
jgi:hypothetical protein